MDILLYVPVMQRGGRSINTMSSFCLPPVNRGIVPKDFYRITRGRFRGCKDIHKPFCQVNSMVFVHLYRYRVIPFQVYRSLTSWREVFYCWLPARPVPYNHIMY